MVGRARIEFATSGQPNHPAKKYSRVLINSNLTGEASAFRYIQENRFYLIPVPELPLPALNTGEARTDEERVQAHA